MSPAIFGLVIPPFVYLGFAFLISSGGLRMRDGSLLSRETTPRLYWACMTVGGAATGLIVVASLVALAVGRHP